MIPSLIHLLVGGILCGEPVELFLSQPEVLQFILEDDARVEEAVHDNKVAFSLLLLGEGDLCQVILAVVRVVGQGVGRLGSETVGRLGGDVRGVGAIRVFR